VDRLDLPQDDFALVIGKVQVQVGTIGCLIECRQPSAIVATATTSPLEFAKQAAKGYPHPIVVFNNQNAFLFHDCLAASVTAALQSAMSSAILML